MIRPVYLKELFDEPEKYASSNEITLRTRMSHHAARCLYESRAAASCSGLESESIASTKGGGEVPKCQVKVTFSLQVTSDFSL